MSLQPMPLLRPHAYLGDIAEVALAKAVKNGHIGTLHFMQLMWLLTSVQRKITDNLLDFLSNRSATSAASDDEH